MIKYDFIRMLAKSLSKQQLEEVFRLASEMQVELYYKTAESAYGSSEDTSATCGKSYALAKSSSDFANGNVYVSAADWEFVVRVLKKAGFQGEICDAAKSKVEEDPVEKAEREYYRKRKIERIECLVVLVIVLLILLVKSF